MLKKSVILLLSVLSLLPIADAKAHCGLNHKEQEMKKAILLVAFGTSDMEARIAFNNIEKLAKKRFPNVEIRWAFTSNIIRKKLAKQGLETDSPQLALAKLQDEGFTHVAVQSLHTTEGFEYHKLVGQVAKFKEAPAKFTAIEIGHPLLVSRSDMLAFVDAMISCIPVERKNDEAVVLMGHGNEHGIGDLVYVATADAFNKKDKLIFTGTVEGAPNFDDVVAQLKASGVKKTYLMPFMSVAGDHAKNDLAGAESDSWKSAFTRLGIECVPILKGTAEYDVIAQLWLNHLDDACKKLGFQPPQICSKTASTN